MNPVEIRQHILDALHRVAPEADLNQLDAQANLREALDIDSFDFLNVLIALNEKLGISIPESAYRQVSTLDGMVDYLRKASLQQPTRTTT